MSHAAMDKPKSAGKKLRIGMVGLGRLGKRHAENLALKVGGAVVAAACSLVPEELDWAGKELGIEALYDDYGTMIAEAGLDAVFIASSSSAHAAQIIQGLERGLHVFCEKPMGVSVEECLAVEKAVALRPDLTFMVGFVRRFDPSYRYAKKLIDEGSDRKALPRAFPDRRPGRVRPLPGEIQFRPRAEYSSI